MRQDRAFTLIEIIVVIVIITVLAGVLVPVVLRARRKGRETECMSNLRQIHLALQMFRDANIRKGKALNPPWLNTLIWDNPGAEHPKNLMKQELLICPLDDSEGKEGGKPPGPWAQFEELDEYKWFSDPARFNPPVERPCSYMYEFNMAADCSWGWWCGSEMSVTLPGYPDVDAEPEFDEHAFIDLDGNRGTSKWGEVKTAQMRYGDTYINASGIGSLLPESRWRGYPPSRFPILRCFWHTDNPDTNTAKILNLSYEGRTFRSGAFWEQYAAGQ